MNRRSDDDGGTRTINRGTATRGTVLNMYTSFEEKLKVHSHLAIFGFARMLTQTV